MSTVCVIKENNTLVLGTDSRFMRHDFSGVASDAEQKIFEIAPGTFIAPSGWKVACDFQLAAARRLVGATGTTDIRLLARALAQESIPHLEQLTGVLRSVQHLNEKIQRALDGQLMMHAVVLAGRTADGELGYVNLVFRIQAGRVVCESGEYFADEWRLYSTSGDPARQVAQEDPAIMDGTPVEVVQKLLAGLGRACPTIGGQNQIVRIDDGGARWISNPPEPGASVVHGLEIATALFAGDTVFARTGGGKVTINSAGIALADNLTAPNSTLTLASTGATVAKGANNVQVDANGVSINGPSGTLTATSLGVKISNGSSSVTVSPSAVTIVNGSLSAPTITCSSGSNSLTINTTDFIKIIGPSGFQAILNWLSLQLSQGSYQTNVVPSGFSTKVGTQGYAVTPTGIQVTDNLGQNFSSISGVFAYLKPDGTTGYIQVAQGIVTSIT